MTDTAEVVRAALARCRRVSAGVDELLPLFGAAMPFQGADLAELALIERTAAVAFLKRLEQLQDLVARLARAAAAWEGDEVLSHRDVADWLEKGRFVDRAEAWMRAVRLRNRLVHEYPVDEAEQVLRLNDSWAAMPPLRATLDALAADLGRKGLS